MVIYAEYLVAENLITGMVLIILTGKLCGTHLKKSMIFLGGCLCGIYSLTITLELNAVVALLSKLLFSFFIIAVIFRPKQCKPFLKLLGTFYISSFAMGGITIGLMYFTGSYGVANNTFVYLNHITYLNILAGCTLTYFLISCLARWMKDRVLGTNINFDAEIILGEKRVTAKGTVDSGNFLREPISNRMAFIITLKLADELFSSEFIDILSQNEDSQKCYETLLQKNMAQRIRLIPYSAVHNQRGLMVGVKPDIVILRRGQEERNLMDVYLAINKGDFKAFQGDCEILLHRDILDKGIGCYV